MNKTCIEPVGIGWSWAPCGEPATHRVSIKTMPRSSGLRCEAHTMLWQDVLVHTALPEEWVTIPLWVEDQMIRTSESEVSA